MVTPSSTAGDVDVNADGLRPPRSRTRWTLLTNHGAVLLYLAVNPNGTVREVARAVGITERAAARILRDLREADYLIATRNGRRNSYEVDRSRPLRHPIAGNMQVADLLLGLVGRDGSSPSDTSTAASSATAAVEANRVADRR